MLKENPKQAVDIEDIVGLEHGWADCCEADPIELVLIFVELKWNYPIQSRRADRASAISLQDRFVIALSMDGVKATFDEGLYLVFLVQKHTR